MLQYISRHFYMTAKQCCSHSKETSLIQKSPLLKYFILSSRGQFRFLRTSLNTSAEYQTTTDIRNKLKKLLNQDKAFTPGDIHFKGNKNLAKQLPKSQSELPMRSMKDSYDIVYVPLSSDHVLKDKYTNHLGQIRVGRLLEDLDNFAGYCSFKHCYYPFVPENTPPPIWIVTISVSRIEFLEQIKPDVDIQITGKVCWVGTSSLEVIVWLHQKINGKLVEITRALFLMAARNSVTQGAAVVNPIRAETPEEEELMKGGEDRKITRQKKMKESLLNTVPTEEELHVVHSLFIKTIDPKGMFLDRRILPPNSKWMHDAIISNLVFCHPEHRNLHNKIFGGFLMRHALELSWIVAFLHGLKVPKLFQISDIGFYSPVNVGSVVKMTGSVTYVEKNYVQVCVTAESFSFAETAGTHSTVFNFTYDLGKSVDAVFPGTYLEAMKFLDGRRHFKSVIGTAGKK